MSKNMTRKGLAFGAGIALVASGLAALPAQANASGPVTLLPSAGTTLTSIIGSPVTIVSKIDPIYVTDNVDTTDAAGTDAADNENSYAKLIIVNPDAAELVINMASAPVTEGFSTFDANGDAVAVATVDQVDGVNEANAAADLTTAKAAGSQYVDFTLHNGATNEYVTNAEKIAINIGADGSIPNVTIDTTETTDVEFTVQVLIDTDVSTAATDLAKYNVESFERISSVDTVKLLAPGSVTATTTLTVADRGADTLTATVVYSGGVNHNFIASATKVSFYKDGVSVVTDNDDDADAGATTYTAGTDGITDVLNPTTSNAAGTRLSVTVYEGDDDALGAGVWSARAIYVNEVPSSGSDVYAGPASAVVDLRNGTNTTVKGVKSSVLSTANIKYNAGTTANEIIARTGTDKITITAQIQKYVPTDLNGDGDTADTVNPVSEATFGLDLNGDGDIADSVANVVEATVLGNLASSGVKVRAIVTGRTVTAGNELTVTAAPGTIEEDGDKITAFGFTNADGQVSFTINAPKGTRGDAFDVAIGVQLSDGTYANDFMSGADVDVVWQNAAVNTFEATPVAYVSGANISVTFAVKDQFGQGIDATSTGGLSVYAEAIVSGRSKPATFSKTQATSNGLATFSFANFAAAGGQEQLKATLYVANTAQSSPAPVFVSVYNVVDTKTVSLQDSYSAAITYIDYVTGNVTVPTDLAKMAAAGLTNISGTTLASKATISGSVLNSNNSGQPGAVVTLSGTGILFRAGNEFALGQVTTIANEQGSFSVDVIAHVVNTAGHTITVTSNGVSATTLFKTYLPTDISDENLALTWNFPSVLVMNTTYAVTAKLADKWGNPINANDADEAVGGTDFGISFDGTGSVQVNGATSTVFRDFNAKGEATVFVRSIKDIAGPGSVVATISGDSEYNTGNAAEISTLGTVDSSNTVDSTATAWNEKLWSNTLSVEVDVLDKAPAAPVTGKVNVGSFNGKLVVYASGLNGARISWKVGGNWGSAVADSNFDIFNRPTPRAGVTVSVQIYVNGVLTLTKSVLTR